jgi:3-dehydroquinate dehydratase
LAVKTETQAGSVALTAADTIVGIAVFCHRSLFFVDVVIAVAIGVVRINLFSVMQRKKNQHQHVLRVPPRQFRAHDVLVVKSSAARVRL